MVRETSSLVGDAASLWRNGTRNERLIVLCGSGGPPPTGEDSAREGGERNRELQRGGRALCSWLLQSIHRVYASPT